MKASIITIGDEILIGQITDTNSGFIAKSLDKIGIEIVEMISISDHKQHILDSFAKYQNKVDLVLITGGLGPTKDDITKHTFCEYFEDHLVRNPEVEAHVIDLIERVMQRPASQINKDQALVPSTCAVLHNAVGTAPGMWMQKENTVFVSMPGVPYEMKYLIENQVVPKVVSLYNRPYIIHKTILTYGQGESLVAERIEHWENQLPSCIKLAYLPSPGRVRLRLSARGIDKTFLENQIAQNVESLSEIIGDIIVGFDDSETLEVMIGQQLTKIKLTVSTAESCTGGKIAATVTAVAGASAYFKGSIVCYSNQSKTNLLQIPTETIENYGAVSQEVAILMAQNAKKIFQTDYAIATTGNAGPSIGDPKAAIGTVFVAIATPSDTIIKEFNLGQPREKVINRAINESLNLLMKEILKNVE